METRKTATEYHAEGRRSSGGFFRRSRIRLLELICDILLITLAAGICGMTGRLIISAVTTVILVRLSFVDAMTLRIPNYCTGALFLPVLMSLFMMGTPAIGERVAGALIVSVPMYLMILAVPGSFGGGDVKLVAVSGLLLGGKGILLAAFLSILMGGSYAIWLLVSKRAGRKSHFAFGPFLAGGIWISLLYGTQILDWYVGMFG